MCVLQKVPQLRCKGFESPTVQQASWIRTLFPNLQSLMNQLLNFFLISKWIEGICISIPSKQIHFLFNSITFLKVKNEHYELSQITNNSRRKYNENRALLTNDIGLRAAFSIVKKDTQVWEVLMTYQQQTGVFSLTAISRTEWEQKRK